MVNSKAAAGFIIRNEDGDPIVAGARCLGEHSISVVESLALRDALWMTRSRGFEKICVQGDSELVIDSILGSCNVPWRLKFIIGDIKGLAASFDFFSWARVYKDANFLTDAIASTNFHINDLHVRDRILPNAAHKAYFFDCMRNRIGCDRGHSL